MVTKVTWIILSIVSLFLGIFLGIIFFAWLVSRKTRQFQEQVDLTDRKQIEDMMGVFGHKPSQEQVNRFISSIKRKRGEKTKKLKSEEE